MDDSQDLQTPEQSERADAQPNAEVPAPETEDPPTSPFAAPTKTLERTAALWREAQEPAEAASLAGGSVAEETAAVPDIAPEASPEAQDEFIIGDLDIDAALAAVSSLSDMLAEQEAVEEARRARLVAEEQSAAERAARLEHPELFFEMPLPVTLHRGSLASVVPGVLLIALGIWLTFAFTTAQTPPETGLVLLAMLASGAVALLAHWLASGRWARGSFFLGLTLLLLIGVGAWVTEPGLPDWSTGWSLLPLAPGIALLLSAVAARPVERRLALPGLLLIMIAAAAYGAIGLSFPADLLRLIETLWFVPLIVLALLVLLPFIFRRRYAQPRVSADSD